MDKQQQQQQPIPFIDLRSQHLMLKPELDAIYEQVIDSSAFIGGKYVKNFETEFAHYSGISNVVSCGNGTDSLFIALKSLNLKAGDEVIVPALTWISSSEVVTLAGANIVFCDIESDSFTLSVTDLKRKITSRTVGIIAVHLYGHPADMPAISKIANDHGLWCIEDCAQAHGALVNNLHVGSFGIASSFSFFPGKNLGALGDAGCICSNNYDLSRSMLLFARHGAFVKHNHLVEGINSRMDSLQAAVLSLKLRYLDSWIKRRIEIAELYTSLLSSIPEVRTPKVKSGYMHSFHLYVIMCKQRDSLMHYLRAHNITTLIHYPTILPLMPAYSRFGASSNDFPVAFNAQNTILSLPIYPELSNNAVIYICSLVKTFFDEN